MRICWVQGGNFGITLNLLLLDGQVRHDLRLLGLGSD